MGLTRRLSAGCLLLFILACSLSFYLEKSPTQEKNNLYFLPQAEYIKIVSGSYRALSAHLLYIKGVLELTDEIPNRTPYLLKLFRLCVELDPKLIDAYIFGGVIVPSKKADIPEGILFLKEAMHLNPGEWRIPFWIGFNYLELGDYKKVIEYYKLASELPASPAYLKTNLAFFYYKSGGAQEGLLYLEGLADTLKDESMLESLKKKIAWLKNIIILEAKVQEYKDRFGEWPFELQDLVKKGLLANIPGDPFGKGFYLDKEPQTGRVKVKSKF
ncbi:MAG: hypothetical protein PHN57_00260 [Candidatus Omnitrophica bacterium]|nr:hypothetical protein [Candidatus Omnitrophota bacterium]